MDEEARCDGSAETAKPETLHSGRAAFISSDAESEESDVVSRQRARERRAGKAVLRESLATAVKEPVRTGPSLTAEGQVPTSAGVSEDVETAGSAMEAREGPAVDSFVQLDRGGTGRRIGQWLREQAHPVALS